jgi:hypothetical protein
MIYKCIDLFNLLPTSQPHYWLIAADWLEEENLDITASAFRERFFTLENNNINHFKFPTLSKCVFWGGGSGCREGGVNFHGSVYNGFGNGRDSGIGFGNGCGFGCGNNNGEAINVIII